jgi:hypothetical protein
VRDARGILLSKDTVDASAVPFWWKDDSRFGVPFESLERDSAPEGRVQSAALGADGYAGKGG